MMQNDNWHQFKSRTTAPQVLIQSACQHSLHQANPLQILCKSNLNIIIVHLTAGPARSLFSLQPEPIMPIHFLHNC